MNETTYQIYGRKAYANPLKFVGTVTIDTEDRLTAETLKKFGTDAWIELVALPATDILYVIGKAGDA